MAGGSGTRFWPKSTPDHPKQFLSFGPDPRPLLLQTLSRFDGIVKAGATIIVTTERLAAATRTLCGGSIEVLAEPEGRNTAPCLFWAAMRIAETDPESVLLAMPADHLVSDVKEFQRAINAAIARAAANDEIVTVGIRPTRAETGYGYLQIGPDLGSGVRKVDRFVEKPDAARAGEFVKSGKHLWNAGMFVARASVLLREFDQYLPAYRKAWAAAGGNAAAAYPKMEAVSVDVGIMEKSGRVVTVGTDCGWDDLGNWTSLESLGKKWGLERREGVTLSGSVTGVDASGNVIDAPGRTVGLLGVHNLVIVECEGRILVADKSRLQDLRELTKKITSSC
jgi:mannose-1-phosphate guanylyltransferase/mannose-6-phosphate isomerase